MANDRVYMRCPCGSLFGIAKTMGDAWYLSQDKDPRRWEKLGRWLAEHDACEDGRYPARPILVFESDPDFQPGLDAAAGMP